MCADMMYNIKPKDHSRGLQESMTWNEGTRSNVAIPGCCRCNDHGTCQRCSCTKAGRVCVSCLPLKRGHCSNMSPTTNECDTSRISNSWSPELTTSPQPKPPLSLHPLPLFIPVEEPVFIWGQHDTTSFTQSLNAAYEDGVYWRKNHFTPPPGNIGQAFIDELARLLRTFTEKTALESCSFIFCCKCHVFASAQETS